MKIFINPGHGGNDPGACGYGLKEAVVALNIAKRVENYLRAVGYDVKTFQFDGLQEICDDANAFNADLFVSIHCNAGGGKGTETFYLQGSAKGETLAACIQKQIVNSLPVVNRGVKTSTGLYVLKYTDMPAVLVETAFIDNQGDATLLRDKEDDFARAIARGVTDFYSNQKPLPDVVDVPSTKAGSLSPHFDHSEFTCHCCGKGNVDPKLIDLLEQLRTKAGAPIHVNCGYRCPKHNAEVGGVPNSQHVLGTAADITIPRIEFDKTVQLVKSLPFDGTGFYSPLEKGGAWFIHVDVRNGGKGSHIEWWE